MKAETIAAETAAAPPREGQAEAKTGAQTKQLQKPKAPAQRLKAAQPAKPAKKPAPEQSKPAQEKSAAPAKGAKKPARKSGKLSTVTTVKKPRAKK